MATVSVIIPTHNRVNYVVRAIASVLAQTYRDFELIVVDDGSTDNTREVLQKYAKDIRYIYQPNRGRSEARNAGIRAAFGDYIAFLDSDDVWLPVKLERQMPILASDQRLGMLHSYTSVIDGEGNPMSLETRRRLKAHQDAVRRGYTYEQMSYYCTMFLSSVVVDRKCIEQVGTMDLCIPAFEDWDWYLRIALDYKIATIPEVLVLYRLHSANTPSKEFTEGRIKTCIKHLCILERHRHKEYYKRAQRNFLLNLATAYYLQGRTAESGRRMRQAIRLDPKVLFDFKWRSAALCAVLPAEWVARVRKLKEGRGW